MKTIIISVSFWPLNEKYPEKFPYQINTIRL